MSMDVLRVPGNEERRMESCVFALTEGALDGKVDCIAEGIDDGIAEDSLERLTDGLTEGSSDGYYWYNGNRFKRFPLYTIKSILKVSSRPVHKAIMMN